MSVLGNYFIKETKMQVHIHPQENNEHKKELHIKSIYSI